MNKSTNFWTTDIAVLSYFALATLVLHLLTNRQYGYFADEFYYIAAGEHLDWGFAEYPPLTPILANISRWLLGNSLSAIRLFPALSGALSVLLTGVIVRELGGGKLAQCLAATSVIIAPGYLFMQTILTMNAFEPLFWMLCAYITILIIKNEAPTLWLLVGLTLGIGLMNKYSLFFFAFSLLAGLLITPERRLLRNKWIWLACLIALVICLPNLLWQNQHGWPFIEHQREANLYEKKDFLHSSIDLILQQIILMNPVTFPIWLLGIYYYLFSPNGRKYRALGWTFFIIVGLFLLFEARYYYLLPIYPMFLASGAIVIERFIRSRRYLKYTILSTLIAGGIIMAPIGLPILPIEQLINYSNSIYRPPSLSKNFHETKAQAPWHFKLMLGWEDTVATVARVYHSLTQIEQSKCAILAWTYDDAGAIDFFSKTYNIPKAISGHTGYYFWGPRDYSGEIVLSVGGDSRFLKKIFNQVEKVNTITHEKIVGIKSNIPIYICRGIKKPLREIWPSFKYYFKHQLQAEI